MQVAEETGKVWLSQGWSDYQLLDTGNRQRLERYGQHLVVRPEPQALWRPANPDHFGWKAPQLRYTGAKDVYWHTENEALLEGWYLRWQSARFLVKPTPFRHLGIFPEQAAQWQWIEDRVQKAVASGRSPRVLNLFAYTGIASTVAALAGAREVCHVDAAKGTVFWASDNAKASGEQLPIRWIVDDVRKFIRREAERGIKYDLIIMDPPVFGRGSKGEVWRLEEDLTGLLGSVATLFSNAPVGFLMNCYATTMYPQSVARVVEQILGSKFADIEVGSVYLQESESKKLLQTGFCLSS